MLNLESPVDIRKGHDNSCIQAVNRAIYLDNILLYQQTLNDKCHAFVNRSNDLSTQKTVENIQTKINDLIALNANGSETPAENMNKFYNYLVRLELQEKPQDRKSKKYSAHFFRNKTSPLAK